MTTSREAVIPAWNESATIAEVVKKTGAFVDRVIVVDDASTDDTAIKASLAGATVITHQESRGYLKSLKSGTQATSAVVIVFLDADGEHDPKDIPDGGVDLAPHAPVRAWLERLAKLPGFESPPQRPA